MNVATFEGTVVNGQIRLPENLHLPEQTKVYVVIPGVPQASAVKLMSPRLAHPEQANDFKMVVIPNANV